MLQVFRAGEAKQGLQADQVEADANGLARLREMGVEHGQDAAQYVYGGAERGRKLGVCRASYKGGTHLGKVVAGKCNIGWGGKGIVLKSFQVLVQR